MFYYLVTIKNIGYNTDYRKAITHFLNSFRIIDFFMIQITHTYYSLHGILYVMIIIIANGNVTFILDMLNRLNPILCGLYGILTVIKLKEVMRR